MRVITATSVTFYGGCAHFSLAFGVYLMFNFGLLFIHFSVFLLLEIGWKLKTFRIVKFSLFHIDIQSPNKNY